LQILLYFTRNHVLFSTCIQDAGMFRKICKTVFKLTCNAALTLDTMLAAFAILYVIINFTCSSATTENLPAALHSIVRCKKLENVQCATI